MTAFDGSSGQDDRDDTAAEPLNPVDNKHVPHIVADTTQSHPVKDAVNSKTSSSNDDDKKRGLGEIIGGTVHHAVVEALPPLQAAAAPLMSTRAVCIQLLMSVLANFSVLSIGMGMSFPSVSITDMTNANHSMALEQHEFSWFASVNSVVSPIGGLMVSVILDRIGRKRTFYLINVLAIASWLIKATASRTDRSAMFAQVMVARVMLGIMCGLASAPCAIYTAEIVHASLRGRMSIITPLGISVGVLFTYVIGYYIPTDWRLISYISSLISLAALICVYFLPETPSWLISKGRYKEAEESMRFFRGQSRSLSAPISAACQAEFDTLLARHRSAAAQANAFTTETLLQKFRQPGLYRPLAIMFTFFTLQQASGLFVVVVYAVKITRDAGVILDPFLVAVYLGVMRIIGTLAVGFLMDRFGRRILCLLSCAVMAICMLGMAAYVDSESLHAYTWLPLALILLYFLAGSLGLLTLPFTMQAELYPQRYRGLASGLTTCVLFFMCFVFTKLYPTMVTHMGSRNVFAFYSAVSAGSVAFVYWFLPETKGKTLEQIADMFRKREPYERRNENLMLSVQALPLNGGNVEKEARQ